MWLFTPNGFLSIVADRDHARHLLVRARAREDLAWFCKETGCGEPVETAHADYRWRVSVPVMTVAWFALRQAQEIDYENFKDAVAERQGHDRAHTYLQVWSAMRQLQET